MINEHCHCRMEMPAPCSICGEIYELNSFPLNPWGTDLLCPDCLADRRKDMEHL